MTTPAMSPGEPLADLNALALPALWRELSRDGLVERLLTLAREEDLGIGAEACDATTRAWPTAQREVTLHVTAREPMVVAGLEAVPMLVNLFGPGMRWRALVQDGARASAGARLGTLTGPQEQVLVLERTLLNLLSRLCGIATLTSRYAEAARRTAPPGAGRVLDTRKTTPGLRRLEKYAVRCGGGLCHRLGLYDAVLVKDNHLATLPLGEQAAALRRASARARSLGPVRFVEAEADSLEQARAFMALGAGVVDIVLLDNMAPPLLAEAVAHRDAQAPGVLLEASGGVTLDSIGAIAATGVDRISVGAITHGARAVDIGLDAE